MKIQQTLKSFCSTCKNKRYLIAIITFFILQQICLFFGIWQFDMIVCGPVWWTDGISGWCWNGPGAYADSYFQCFLWKTTIGMAYDTLLLIIYAGAVLPTIGIAYSVYKWIRQ